MFHIVLVQPEIPPNTGNVIRLAANTGCALHLVEPLGFSMDDKLLQRAGLDYHEYASVKRHLSWPAFLAEAQPDPARLFAFTTRATRSYADVAWREGDWLVFGSESAGLPAAIREQIASDQRLRLPMRAGQRSLNLSNAVAVAVFEAWQLSLRDSRLINRPIACDGVRRPSSTATTACVIGISTPSTVARCSTTGALYTPSATCRSSAST
jgi:tRNA (cytidine/uridine-2'-O-)-methyltransferase